VAGEGGEIAGYTADEADGSCQPGLGEVLSRRLVKEFLRWSAWQLWRGPGPRDAESIRDFEGLLFIGEEGSRP